MVSINAKEVSQNMIRERNVFLILFIIVASLILFGCSADKYNAKMYSSNKDWIQASFLEENKVSGAYYKNPDYDKNDSNSAKYYYDKTSPESRTFVFDDLEKFDDVFVKEKMNVDFEKEIVLLYIFADIYSEDCFITNIQVDNQILTIYYNHKNANNNGAAMPVQRCIIVTMDKIDVSSVNFIEK